jgi:uncharacterized cupin superfamily protein
MATLPKRARDIGYIVAKNYYKNPDLLRSETTGPITETRAEAVLQGVQFSDDQQAEVAGLVTTTDGNAQSPLWTMSFGREEMIYSSARRPGNVIVYDNRGGWPIEYLDGDEAWVFEPEVAP